MSEKISRHLALEIASREDIEQMIFLMRGQRVMIDRDLAVLYGVETKHLNRQVKRNPERFPEEFVFQLNRKERDGLGDKLSPVQDSETFLFAALCLHRERGSNAGKRPEERTGRQDQHSHY